MSLTATLTNSTASTTTFNGISSGTFNVTATSLQDSNVSATASVAVATVAVATPVPVPSNCQAMVGGTVSFSAKVSGAVNTGVAWAVSGGGTISPAGVFTAGSEGSFSVTATSIADPTKTSAPITVQVVPLSIAISPTNASVRQGTTQKFTAIITSTAGTPSQEVTWSVAETNGGSIAVDGTYTPSTIAGDYTIKAMSTQDSTCYNTVKVHVPGWTLALKKDILYFANKEVAEVDAAGVPWTILTDHRGNPRLSWDGSSVSGVDNQHLVAQKFMPFGEALNYQLPAGAFIKGFTNHEQTDPSGLIYMQARFYAPIYGRFLSPDPALDQSFQNTQKWNIYSYVSNNPVTSFDANGQWEEVGHYWTMYATALAVGFDNDRALKLAQMAWAPDTDSRSATSHLSMKVQSDYSNMMTIHLLNGRNAKDVQAEATEKFRQMIANSHGLTDLGGTEQENIAHGFGDKDAHETMLFGGNGNMYKAPLGHAMSSVLGFNPDNPYWHVDAYKNYASGLYDILSDEAKKSGLKPTMDKDTFLGKEMGIVWSDKLPSSQKDDFKGLVDELNADQNNPVSATEPAAPEPFNGG